MLSERRETKENSLFVDHRCAE